LKKALYIQGFFILYEFLIYFIITLPMLSAEKSNQDFSAISLVRNDKDTLAIPSTLSIRIPTPILSVRLSSRRSLAEG